MALQLQGLREDQCLKMCTRYKDVDRYPSLVPRVAAVVRAEYGVLCLLVAMQQHLLDDLVLQWVVHRIRRLCYHIAMY